MTTMSLEKEDGIVAGIKSYDEFILLNLEGKSEDFIEGYQEGYSQCAEINNEDDLDPLT
jgi:hypothetical protein